MKNNRLSTRPLRFSAAVGCLLLAAGLADGDGAIKAQPLSQEPVSKAGRLQQDEGARRSLRHSRGVNNRIGPKRRTGKAGSEEAKIDSEQARELYIRRKLRLEQIKAQQEETYRDKATLAAKRARMQAKRVEAARALRKSEERLAEIEEELAKTRIKVKEHRQALDEKSAQMSALFALMQGMSREPPRFSSRTRATL